jgi:hypothetical protein
MRETNNYAAQKIQARSFIPLQSRMRDWKPVTTDEMSFRVDGNDTEAHATITFFKKLYFGDSNLWLYYFYGSV